jgi:putative endonuclease
MFKDTMHNKELGNKGESLAQKHYEKIGYVLLNQKVNSRNSELDLVFEKGGEILFVEVKTVEIGGRVSMQPEDNFTWGKQRHFKRGIELYLVKSEKKYKDIRIDLACVYYHVHKNTWTIKTYENIILE